MKNFDFYYESVTNIEPPCRAGNFVIVFKSTIEMTNFLPKG